MNRHLCLLVMVAAVAAGLVCWWLVRPPERHLKEAYRQIRLGMTEQEVDELVGSAPHFFSWPDYPVMRRPNKCWRDADFAFFVSLDEHRVVQFKAIDYDHKPTLIDRIRKRLGW